MHNYQLRNIILRVDKVGKVVAAEFPQYVIKEG